MDESVVCLGEDQENYSARQTTRNAFEDSVAIIGGYNLRSNNRRKARREVGKSKKKLVSVLTVDLTRETEKFQCAVLPEKQVNNEPECALCFESLLKVDVRVIECGHVFCKICLDELIAMNNMNCPKCRACFNKSSVRPVYF